MNDEQLAAVGITDGSALVVAGAGTGKTRVITERITRLINDGVKPENILALTFTEKAAGEMIERISELSLSASLDATIATYNGFGNDLLKAYGSEFGLGIVRLLGEVGQLVFLREHFDELELDYFAPISNPDGQLETLKYYVSLLKQQLVTPEKYYIYVEGLLETDEATRLDKQKHHELARFYQKYLELCREHQVIDYDDQIFLTIELLRARPNILARLQDKYQYILVDEFQDTNPMQSALVDMLANKRKNLMVVGDDDQSIYGWRGATLANILDFKKTYPLATDITLIENYRSTQSILDAAYRLIQNNNPNRLESINNLNKRLHAQNNDGPAPTSRHFSSLESELTWVADDIKKRLKDGQNPGQIAILARRSAIVQKVHEALELQDIPHAVAGLSNDLYVQSGVTQIIEVLKTINDPSDNMALFHTLSGPIFSLNQTMLASLAAEAKNNHAQLSDTIKQSEQEAFIKALATIDDWRLKSANLSTGDLAYTILSDSGWKDALYANAKNDTNILTQVQALSAWFKTLKEFERIAGVPSVQNYLTSLPVLKSGGGEFEDASLDISDSLVNVLSVHRSKGLEWDTVYIVDCTEGSFPMRGFGGGLEIPDELRAVRSEADEKIAEERRLMYVAVTRARHELVLSYGDRHGSGAPRKPSRFLSEMFNHAETEADILQKQGSLELFAPHISESTVPLPKTMQRDEKIVLSVSQIVKWLECPQDFYYRYVLAMPTPPNPSSAYGTAIHGAIQDIFDGRRAGNIPDFEILLEQVKASLPQSGYTSARSRERTHEQAVLSLQRIYERFKDDTLPIADEKPFAIDIPDTPLQIKGRIDAIYQLDKGVEIRDFKTSSSVTTPEKAKSRATSSSQLTLYALAWQIQHDELPGLLTLDFVETGQVGSVRKTQKSIDTLLSKLKTMVVNLESGNYPLGRDHTFCAHPHDA